MDNTERIDKYLKGIMDTEERLAFEEELDRNEELAQELLLQKEMFEFLKHKESDTSLEQKLKTIGSPFFESNENISETPNAQKKSGKIVWITLSAAATILLIIYFFSLRSEENLYKEYAAHPVLAMVDKSDANTFDWAATEQAFNQGDFEKAREGLEVFFIQNPGHDEARLYYSISLIETNEAEKARKYLEPLLEDKNPFQDYVKWYYALSYVYEKDHENARKYLSLQEEDSEFYQRSQELLEKLEK